VPEELTRTTLRLPTELHRRLKVTAASENTTSEAILVEAVRRELDRRSPQPRQIEMPRTMNATLAEIFLQSMPTFALIKDRRGRIVWVNLFVERSLELTLREIIGETITDLGFTDGIQRDTIQENIRNVVRDGSPRMFTEGMNLKGLGRVTVRAQRYLFNGMLGDISFVENDINDMSYAAITDVLRRIQRSTLDTGIVELLVPFLAHAPVAIVIKRPMEDDSEILWGNDVYLNLVGKNADETFGRLTTEVLGVSHDHPIVQRENEVVERRRARMSKESLPRHAPRWSLRFPIYDHDGAVALIGVVSPNFQQTDANSR
jgi:PAS domain-containing protein